MIQQQKTGALLTITLTQPFLDVTMIVALRDIAQQIQYDDSVSVVHVRSEAPRFWHSVAHDETDIVDYQLSRQFSRLCEAWVRIRQPIVMDIEGKCGHYGLAFACLADFRFIQPHTEFYSEALQQKEIPIGGVTRRLAQLLDYSTAMHLLVGGATLTAEQAVARGFALLSASTQETQAFCERLCEQSALGLQYTKESIVRGVDMTFHQALQHEMDLYMLLQTSHDRLEGVEAYLQKRPPQFKGE